MAFYNPIDRSITLRIVYDGLGTAGKTTNIKQLHSLYSYHRRGDVYAPETTGERTAYFDWLDMAVGRLDDEYDLFAQVVTVPGQFALAVRRWTLLEQPDVIVSVCDSTRGGLERSRLGLAFLHRLRELKICPDVPIVVQANKRDLPDAVSLEEFRTVLNLDARDEVVESIASTGEGVRLTFLTALDLARARLRVLCANNQLATLSSTSKFLAAEDLLAHLKQDDDVAEDAALDVISNLQ